MKQRHGDPVCMPEKLFRNPFIVSRYLYIYTVYTKRDQRGLWTHKLLLGHSGSPALRGLRSSTKKTLPKQACCIYYLHLKILFTLLAHSEFRLHENVRLLSLVWLFDGLFGSFRDLILAHKADTPLARAHCQWSPLPCAAPRRDQ